MINLLSHRGPARLAAGLGVLAMAGVVAACGGPGNFTAHGNDQACVDAQDITDGSQVTVTDSSHKVIGTGALAEDNSTAAQKLIKEYDTLQVSLGTFGDQGPGMSIYKFTITGLPAGLPRYGVSVGQNRGTVWFSEKQMRQGPGLDLGCS